MKKLVLVMATIAAFSFQAQASEVQCVPTRTVAEAKVELENGLRHLDENLQAEYAAAQATLQLEYSSRQTRYDQRVQEINARYEQEFAQIREELNPGWNTALEEAVARHNQDLLQAKYEYEHHNEFARDRYYATVEAARVNYNQRAAELTAEYNRSVCAQ